MLRLCPVPRCTGHGPTLIPMFLHVFCAYRGGTTQRPGPHPPSGIPAMGSHRGPERSWVGECPDSPLPGHRTAPATSPTAGPAPLPAPAGRAGPPAAINPPISIRSHGHSPAVPGQLRDGAGWAGPGSPLVSDNRGRPSGIPVGAPGSRRRHVMLPTVLASQWASGHAVGQDHEGAGHRAGTSFPVPPGAGTTPDHPDHRACQALQPSCPHPGQRWRRSALRGVPSPAAPLPTAPTTLTRGTGPRGAPVGPRHAPEVRILWVAEATTIGTGPHPLPKAPRWAQWDAGCAWSY